MRGSLLGGTILVASLVLATAVGAADVDPPGYRDLVSQKDAIARALAEPIADCVQRRDTRHVAFHGCVDWHSAVHGTWALIAYERATGDRRYEPIVRTILSAANIVAERALILAQPDFEMPYGRSWFLRLAIDYEKQFADGGLAPMAADVAASLLRRFTEAPADPAAGAYDSDSWALINLLDYARFVGDAAMERQVRDIVTRSFAGPESCPVAAEAGEFMAICTNRAALVAETLPADEFRKWAAAFFAPIPAAFDPITAPATAHENGLDFSRAWGLAAIYRATGEARYADAYAAHFNAAYRVESRWKGGYRTVAHWVAQFGMYALQPLFGRDKGR